MATFSDALPIQFYPPECETWNESSHEGEHHYKFCQPFNCDDTIRIEFTDSVSGDTNMESITLPALATWKNRQTGTLIDWTTGASPSITFGVNQTSEILYFDNYSFIPGYRYRITLNFDFGAGVTTIRTRMYDESFNPISGISKSSIGIAEPGEVILEFEATSDTVIFGVTAFSSISSSGGITINSISGQRSIPDDFILSIFDEDDSQLQIINFSKTEIRGQDTSLILYSTYFTFSDYNICDQNVYLKVYKSTGTPDIEIAKTDAISVKTSHVETTLIKYSNHRNYAAIYYQNVSPDQDFYIRIPAVFNKQRLPQESESLQLSSNRVINLNSQIKVQKRLSTGRMPNYMHLKMALVLRHQIVYIAGFYWVLEGEYERIEGTTRDSLEKYIAWLTKKEYVVRNIL